jgi:hypothetical protein
MKKTALLLLCAAILLFGFSCRKNKSYDLSANVNVANDVILSISAYNTVFTLLIKARVDSSMIHTGHSTIDGATVRFDSTEMEYYFDYNGTLCPDSVTRSGRIEVEVSGDILQQGTCAIVFFLGYTEDRGLILGNDSIVNEGINGLGQMVFSNSVTTGSVKKFLAEKTIEVNLANRYKALASGLTGGHDILFLVSGNISGQSSKGYSFNGSIRDTLLDAFNCPWIQGGIIDITIPDIQVTSGFIDFMAGDGCSDTIAYTFNESLFKVAKNQWALLN